MGGLPWAYQLDKYCEFALTMFLDMNCKMKKGEKSGRSDNIFGLLSKFISAPMSV